MASTVLDHLKALHTSAIDARNGYREAVRDAEEKPEQKAMTKLFRDMAALHDCHATELAGELTGRGERVGHDGSFMSTLHETIMDVRSLFGGLDESVLPGLIDGEKRNTSKYESAIREMGVPAELADLLTQQRDRLLQKIRLMENEHRTHARAS